MPKHHDALLRHWHLLRLVPRYPQKITIRDIRRCLREDGFEITERSLQRDLNDLSEIFPLHCDNRDKPFGWSWLKDAARFDLPGLTASEALMLVMAEQHLRDLLPTPMFAQLKHHFRTAHEKLAKDGGVARYRAWTNKVRRVPPTQPLLAAKIDPEVQRIVTEALLNEHQLNIRYLRRGEKSPVDYRIHPLGLIQRGPMLYLSCRIFDYPDVRTLALNRIRSATALDVRADYPKGFTLDKQIEAGTWGFGDGEIISLVLIFQPGCGDHLHETPLDTSQRIESLPDGRLKVTAQLPATPQLSWWLLGFGEGVEVVGPKSLRNEMTEVVRGMAEIYTRRKPSATK